MFLAFNHVVCVCVFLCMFVCLCVYVWAAVSAGYPALLFLLMCSTLHHLSLQY